MKKLCIPLLLLVMAACSHPANHHRQLQNQIDSLKAALKDTYKPGFGEFMSSIQVHHDKLWIAGIDQNWKLADFEINEIQESLDGIQQYCTDRPERTSLPMINPALDSLRKAIRQQDLSAFKDAYVHLTQTCNSCHQATHHGFNVITIPSAPPFSDQEFKVPHQS